MKKILKWILITFGVLVLIRILMGHFCQPTFKQTESTDNQQTNEPQPEVTKSEVSESEVPQPEVQLSEAPQLELSRPEL